MSRYWYSFKGQGFDPYLSSSYNLVPGFPSCTTGPNLCAIYSPGGTFPDPIVTPSNLSDYIADALAGTGTPRPLGGKFFVYLKPA